MLKNIIINLLSNAIKYSKEEQAINFTTDFNNQHIEIKVKDAGIGISKAEQKHLFERFFRARNAVNIPGTGLGLNIVKKYIDLMGGSISFESEIESGTTFTINIPQKY